MEIMKCYGGVNRVNSEKKLSQFFLISEKTNGENKMAKWIKVLTGCVVAVLVFFLNGIEAGEHLPENRK